MNLDILYQMLVPSNERCKSTAFGDAKVRYYLGVLWYLFVKQGLHSLENPGQIQALENRGILTLALEKS